MHQYFHKIVAQANRYSLSTLQNLISTKPSSLQNQPKLHRRNPTEISVVSPFFDRSNCNQKYKCKCPYHKKCKHRNDSIVVQQNYHKRIQNRQLELGMKKRKANTEGAECTRYQQKVEKLPKVNLTMNGKNYLDAIHKVECHNSQFENFLKNNDLYILAGKRNTGNKQRDQLVEEQFAKLFEQFNIFEDEQIRQDSMHETTTRQGQKGRTIWKGRISLILSDQNLFSKTLQIVQSIMNGKKRLTILQMEKVEKKLLKLIQQAEGNGIGKEKEKGRKINKMKTYLNQLGSFIQQERGKRKKKEAMEEREDRDKENRTQSQAEKQKKKRKKNYGTSIRMSEQLDNLNGKIESSWSIRSRKRNKKKRSKNLTLKSGINQSLGNLQSDLEINVPISRLSKKRGSIFSPQKEKKVEETSEKHQKAQTNNEDAKQKQNLIYKKIKKLQSSFLSKKRSCTEKGEELVGKEHPKHEGQTVVANSETIYGSDEGRNKERRNEKQNKIQCALSLIKQQEKDKNLEKMKVFIENNKKFIKKIELKLARLNLGMFIIEESDSLITKKKKLRYLKQLIRSNSCKKQFLEELIRYIDIYTDHCKMIMNKQIKKISDLTEDHQIQQNDSDLQLISVKDHSKSLKFISLKEIEQQEKEIKLQGWISLQQYTTNTKSLSRIWERTVIELPIEKQEIIKKQDPSNLFSYKVRESPDLIQVPLMNIAKLEGNKKQKEKGPIKKQPNISISSAFQVEKKMKLKRKFPNKKIF